MLLEVKAVLFFQDKPRLRPCPRSMRSSAIIDAALGVAPRGADRASIDSRTAVPAETRRRRSAPGPRAARRPDAALAVVLGFLAVEAEGQLRPNAQIEGDIATGARTQRSRPLYAGAEDHVELRCPTRAIVERVELRQLDYDILRRSKNSAGVEEYG